MYPKDGVELLLLLLLLLPSPTMACAAVVVVEDRDDDAVDALCLIWWCIAFPDRDAALRITVDDNISLTGWNQGATNLFTTVLLLFRFNKMVFFRMCLTYVPVSLP